MGKWEWDVDIVCRVDWVLRVDITNCYLSLNFKPRYKNDRRHDKAYQLLKFTNLLNSSQSFFFRLIICVVRQRLFVIIQKMDKSKDNPKARGLEHIKNKKKSAKGRSLAHIPKPKSIPVLESNWDRYEQEDNEKKVDSSTDFSILANVPITHGSHFQFKSDKDIAQEIEVECVIPLFDLDLNILDQSLSTIPFTKRSGIDTKYFTQNQQKVMFSTAMSNSKNYQTYLDSNNLSNKPSDLIFDSENVELNEDNSEEDTHLQNNEKELQKEEINISTTNNVIVTPKPTESGEPDLEQWLDDFLDD